MSLSIVFPVLDKTFNQFVEELLGDDFDTFLKLKNDNRKKGKVFEYFIYEFLIKNGITAEINMTYISFSKDIYRTLSDGNTDVHGQCGILNYFCQCKYKNERYKIQANEMREFLNSVLRKTQYQIGFLVSNVELGDNALNELNISPVKDRVCVCYDYEIVEKKYEKHVEKLEKYNEKLEKEVKEIKEEVNVIKKQNDLILEILKKK
ncbi:7735_t:CDS:2 [Scutellospora calospora]|uniref:7735_t:CDS:1 n=1 Tax=Scutellospora calospora TaxID=85575 RepID=A0ACA9KTX6_9GLOM|nr:7735_t:CDS:2 [Scutellospora calospora]